MSSFYNSNEKVRKLPGGGAVFSYSNVTETGAEQLLGHLLDKLILHKQWDSEDNDLRTMTLDSDDEKIRWLILWYVDVYWDAKYIGIPINQEVGFGGAYNYPNRNKAPLTLLKICKMMATARPSDKVARQKFDQLMPWSVRIYFLLEDIFTK